MPTAKQQPQAPLTQPQHSVNEKARNKSDRSVTDFCNKHNLFPCCVTNTKPHYCPAEVNSLLFYACFTDRESKGHFQKRLVLNCCCSGDAHLKALNHKYSKTNAYQKNPRFLDCRSEPHHWPKTQVALALLSHSKQVIRKAFARRL